MVINRRIFVYSVLSILLVPKNKNKNDTVILAEALSKPLRNPIFKNEEINKIFIGNSLG